MITKMLFSALAMLIFVSAQAEVLTVQGTELSGPANCIPFGCPDNYGPHMGFIYKNIPAFTLNAGDTLAYDLGMPNDKPLSFDISLTATSTNGGTSAASSFITIVSNSMPALPKGDDTAFNYELAFTVTSGFTFLGGGLIVDFMPTGTSIGDVNFDQVLMYSNASDPSGFFVKRYYYGAFAGDSSQGDSGYIGNFRIITGEVNNVPEPATVALIGLGLLGFTASRRKSAKSKNA